MRRVGLFGGGFDPIHFGHISVALDLQEQHRLDHIYFCPTYCSPHKKQTPPHVSAHHRFSMISLVVAAIEQWSSWDIESTTERLSYTVETLRALQQKEPSSQLFLLLSNDALEHFEHWKDPEEVLRLAQPLIGMRKADNNIDILPDRWQPIFQKGYTRTRMMQISSTDIRQRLLHKKYCGHLMPAAALEYIQTHHLYYP